MKTNSKPEPSTKSVLQSAWPSRSVEPSPARRAHRGHSKARPRQLRLPLARCGLRVLSPSRRLSEQTPSTLLTAVTVGARSFSFLVSVALSRLVLGWLEPAKPDLCADLFKRAQMHAAISLSFRRHTSSDPNTLRRRSS